MRNAGPNDQIGYHAGKGIRGPQTPVLVDCLGLLIAVAVTSAYVSDVAGGRPGLRGVRLTHSLLGPVWCDSAYQGLAGRVARLRLRIDMVKNPFRRHFAAVYPRWIIERSFAWRSAHRRLGKRDLEHHRTGLDLDQSRRHARLAGPQTRHATSPSQQRR